MAPLSSTFIPLVSLFSAVVASISHDVFIKRDISQLAASYDYIIAGGGTSGLTVADRLTAAFPSKSVLVVEYGKLINSTDILRPAATVPNAAYAFQIVSQPEPGLNNRSFTVTVGKIVGGCSAINAQMFDRGSKADYNAWGEVAGPEFNEGGWNWDGLLKYFRKSTVFTEPTKEIAEKYGYTWDSESAYGGKEKTAIQAVYPPYQWPSESEFTCEWCL